MVFGRFFLPDSYSIITRKAGVLGQITICTGSNWYWWWWCWWWWRRWWRKSPVEPITNVATWKLLSHGKAPGIEGWAKHNHHICDIHCWSFCWYLKIWLQVKVTCATNQCPGQTLLIISFFDWRFGSLSKCGPSENIWHFPCQDPTTLMFRREKRT